MEIGNYVIGPKVGEGTFGRVCKATHQCGQEVAVKILEKNRINDQQDIERVKREIRILQMLHHPSVVQLYEIIETETNLYMFMEYASGGELFEYIEQMKRQFYIIDQNKKIIRIQEQEACRFLQQLLNAIEYIHSLHVVHRDLKPENILLSPSKDILVVDFGLSNTYVDVLKTQCGSPCYAAPEMILGQSYRGVQTDIWSVGVILYAMLCGYLPFEDNNTQALYKKILNADFHIPRFVSIDAKELIRNILTVDPNNRFSIEQIRQHKWFQIYKGDPPKMTGFKEQFQGCHVNLLQNSIFGNKRNFSDDQKTSDTQNEIVEKMQQIVDQIQQEEPNNDVQIQDFDFQNSVRSLTRQKSNQSLHSSRLKQPEQNHVQRLEKLIQSQKFPLPKSGKPNQPIKKVEPIKSIVNKIRAEKKSVGSVGYVENKTVASKSQYEPSSTSGNKNVKQQKSPVTPIVRSKFSEQAIKQSYKLQTEGNESTHKKSQPRDDPKLKIREKKETTPKMFSHKQSETITVENSIIDNQFETMNSQIEKLTFQLNNMKDSVPVHMKTKSMHQSDNHKNIDQWNGPINIQFLTTKDPSDTIRALKKYFQSKSVATQADRYGLQVPHLQMKFKRYQNTDLYILIFEGNNQQAIQQIANDILTNFKL